jgi:putative ABC transport system substrate-binding protein
MRRRDLIKLIGAAAAWPAMARAQGRNRIPRIAVLWHADSAEGEAPYFGSLMQGFESLGYTAGKAAFEHRFPDEKPELFKSMAAELVAREPDVLVAVGGAAPYAKMATANIPIVFMYVPDPLGARLVESIRRPGGNATGLTNFSVDLSAKRLEYLKEFVPTLSRVALLINPSAKISDLYVEQSNTASPKLGLSCKAYPTRTVDELTGAFDAMAADAMQAVVVNAESLFYLGKERIAKLALERRLPTCVWVMEVLKSGALLSYGADQRAIARRVAYYVDRVLKGEKAGDIPVEQPARFELGINVATAKALGLAVPPTLLARADEVIE